MRNGWKESYKISVTGVAMMMCMRNDCDMAANVLMEILDVQVHNFKNKIKTLLFKRMFA